MSASSHRGLDKPGVQEAVVALAAVGVYVTSLKIPFLAWDDNIYITASFRTQTPGWPGFLNIWSSNDVWTQRFIEFFPLRDTFYWALWQLFPNNPLPFHVVNILAHATACVLALTLARRLGFSRAVAFWAALLFAVHPVHVESVAWIAALKDPLFTSLALGSLLAFASYRASRRPWVYGLSLVLLVASLLVKSIALATPLIMMAIERLSTDKTPWRLTLVRVLGPGIICGVFLVQFILVGRATGVTLGPHGGTWGNHAFLMSWAMVRYIQQAFVPISFTIQYCFRLPSGPLDIRLYIILATACGLVALVLLSRRRWPQVTLLVVWFLAFLSPVANIIPFPALMADRYLYAPSVASCLALSLLLDRLPGLTRRLLLLSLVGVFGGLTLWRGVLWQKESNLWEEVVADEACRDDDSRVSALAFIKLANQEGDPDRALGYCDVAIHHAGFRQFLSSQDKCYVFTEASRVALSAQQRDRAKGYARQAVDLCPSLASTWTSLMLATARSEPLTALDASRRAYRLSPTATNQWHRGHARLGAGDPEGVEDVLDAVRAAPQVLCRSFLNWSKTAPATLHARLEAALEACTNLKPH